jgi:hypothetical protein
MKVKIKNKVYLYTVFDILLNDNKDIKFILQNNLEIICYKDVEEIFT